MSMSIKKIAVAHVRFQLRRKRRGVIVVLVLMIGVRGDMIRVQGNRIITEINITIAIKILIIKRIIVMSKTKTIINLLTVKATIIQRMSTATMMTNKEEEIDIRVLEAAKAVKKGDEEILLIERNRNLSRQAMRAQRRTIEKLIRDWKGETHG